MFPFFLQAVSKNEDEQSRKPNKFSRPSSGELEGFRRQSKHIPVLQNGC